MPARARRARTSTTPRRTQPLWTHLSEYTALGLGPATDLCLFLEETGKVAAPGPFLATALFASLTGEEATGTVAIAGASGAWEPNADPVKTFVLEADRVDRIAIVGPGPTLSVVDAPPASALRFVTTVDFSRRIFELDTDAVALNPQPLPPEGARGVARPRLRVARGRDGRHRASHLHDDARVREGTQAVRRADRQLPGDPAQARRDVTRARTRDRRGALRGDERRRRRCDRAPRACHVAKAAAGEAARRILKDGIQIHGGIGYTWEHDLHLFLRRATADEYLLGPTGWHHDRLADLLIDGRE